MNNLEEIKKFINQKEFYGDFEDFYDEFYEDLKDIEFSYIETLKSDDHRWFQVDYNVYEIVKDKNSLGFLCLEEVGVLKSEIMTREDCYYDIKAHNVNKIIKESFEIVN